jgi:microcompartment protein CcmK/EutM
MRLGRVTGRLWATVKTPQHEGRRFLLVQPINADRLDVDEPIVCLDAVGAGAGETGYWVRGKEASLAFYPEAVASDATVVGIVDQITPQDS